MNNCKNKVKHTCGDTVYATCVAYETLLPNFSEITDCPDLDLTTAELYTLIGEIRTQTDLTELGQDCLDYVLVGGKLFVKNALLKQEEEICALKQEIEALKTTALFDQPLTGSGLDLSCLTDACDNTINTVGELFQALITKVCLP